MDCKTKKLSSNMAKVKVAPRSVASKNKVASTKSNKTTPTIIQKKGKVQKIRSNVKEVATDEKLNDYISEYLEIQSKTRLCFVKLNRNTSLLNDSRNIINKTSTTSDALQAQCKDAIDDNPKPSRSNKENAIDAGILADAKPTRAPHSCRYQTNVCNDVSDGLSTRERLGSRLQAKDQRISKLKSCKTNVESSVDNVFQARSGNIKSPTVTNGKHSLLEYPGKENKKSKPKVVKKCVVRLRNYAKVPKPTLAEELNTNGELKDDTASLPFSEIINPCLNQEKRMSLRKLSLSAAKNTLSTTNKNTLATNEKNQVENDDNPSESTQNVQLKDLQAANTKSIGIQRIHFVDQPNSTVHFEHVRNSTVIECNLKETSDSIMPERASTRTHMEENTPIPISASIANLTQILPLPSRPHKFFHRPEDKSIKINPQTAVKEKVLAKKPRLPAKRSSQVRREEIYDFLSQSQTSDSEGNSGKRRKDPTDDIIKKLIAQGKVAVAVNRKGKGRPMLKRRVVKKPKKGTKQPADKKQDNKITIMKEPANRIDNNILAGIKPHTDQESLDDEEDQDHYDNFLDDDADLPADVDFNVNQSGSSAVDPVRTRFQHHITDQEGTFSNLAKSVLISQAGRTDNQRLKAQRLLAMAKKLISTPKNKKIPSTTLNADFSPIVMSTTRPATIPSPWRVDEDAHLPRVFNFSRSSGNLPSFSSDFIPPTPRKENRTNRALQETLDRMSENRQHADSSPLPTIESTSALSRHSLSPLAENPNIIGPSWFSSNDSNAENQTPPNLEPDQTTDSNANIFNLKQIPNPRRALSYRSPLKAINILEVVHLPPLQNLVSTSSKEKTKEDSLFGFEDMAKNDTFKTPSKPPNKKCHKQTPDRELFGFDEFLSQTDMSSQESQADPSIGDLKNPLQEKLHSLRKLRPKSSELEISLQQTKNCKKVPNLFNDQEHVSNAQKSIKQMLCSTMIQQPSTSKECREDLRLRNLKGNRAFNRIVEEESGNISELFKDAEPETTFNEEDPHRTYVRPYKRKRRLKENNYVFLLESDASDDEHNGSSSPEKKNRGHHRSHESDTSPEKPHKKKRKIKEMPELKHFVKEFNEMCKEVEEYEMITEKSA